jgi:hypothetical protein
MMQLYYPEGVAAPQVLPELLKEGIVVAGGLHKDIKGSYFMSVYQCFLISFISFRQVFPHRVRILSSHLTLADFAIGTWELLQSIFPAATLTGSSPVSTR